MAKWVKWTSVHPVLGLSCTEVKLRCFSNLRQGCGNGVCERDFPGNETCNSCPYDCSVHCKAPHSFPYAAVFAPLGIIIAGGTTLSFFWRQRKSRRVDDLDKIKEKDEKLELQEKPQVKAPAEPP